MSYDLDIKTAACGHEVSFDRMVVDWQDFMTLHLAANVSINLRAPINGLSKVKLYIGGQLVPPTHPVYGYSITPDINRVLTADRYYKIMFKKPVRVIHPLIEVSYVTLQPYCLQCSGTGQLNDIKPASNGSVIHVVNTDKMVQKVRKLVLSAYCPFYPQFTCPIKTYIGKKFGVTITDADVTNQVVNALQNMKQIQSSQRTVQHLTPEEMLKDVTDLQAISIDPTSIAVLASLTSYGSPSSTPLSFTLNSTSQLVGNQ